MSKNDSRTPLIRIYLISLLVFHVFVNERLCYLHFKMFFLVLFIPWMSIGWRKFGRWSQRGELVHFTIGRYAYLTCPVVSYNVTVLSNTHNLHTGDSARNVRNGLFLFGSSPICCSLLLLLQRQTVLRDVYSQLLRNPLVFISIRKHTNRFPPSLRSLIRHDRGCCADHRCSDGRIMNKFIDEYSSCCEWPDRPSIPDGNTEMQRAVDGRRAATG